MVHKISMVYGACAYQIVTVIVLKQREGDDEPESDRGNLKKFKVGQCGISIISSFSCFF